MLSLGFPELLIALVVLVLFVGILKSIRRKKKDEDKIAVSTSPHSGSSGYASK
jgi:hypothetical protein